MLVALACLAIQTSRFSKTLPSKTTVKLMRISDIPLRQSWDPSGVHIPFNLKSYVYADKSQLKTHRAIAFTIVIDHTPVKEFPNVVMKVGDQPSYGASTGYVDAFVPKLPYGSTAEFYLSPSMRETDLTVMIAAGPWQTIGESNHKTGKSFGLGFSPTATFNKRSRPADPDRWQIDIVVPQMLKSGNGTYVVVAYDTAGAKLNSAGSVSHPDEKGPFEFEFEATSKPLGRIVLQFRPYEFVKFPSVPLKARP